MADSIPESVDYVVIGGGTAGNVVAARLAEKGFSVLVLEAGKDVSAELEVTTPGLFSVNHTNPERTWGFKSTPQAHCNGREINLPRGKALGGSSSINFMQLNYPAAHEFNEAFKAFGIEGWSWDDLLPYFRKFEKLNPTPAPGVDSHIVPHPGVHGFSGPIEATLPAETTPSRELWFKTMHEVGLETNPDVKSGDNVGVFNVFQAIDSNRARVSSDTAYLKPNITKLPNLHVATQARVTRVVLSQDATPIATGVEYLLQDEGKPRSVKANREIIVSAGSYHTPQVLELSGIGDRSVLEKAGVPLRVESPGVGANLQEHTVVPIVFELPTGVDSFDTLSNPAVAQEEMGKYITQRKGKFAIVPLSYAAIPVDKVFSPDEKAAFKEAVKTEAGDDPFLKKMIELQLDWLDNEKTTFIEIMEGSAFFPTTTHTAPEPGKTYVSLNPALQYPLSRGTVHITSSDPTRNPDVNPKFFEKPTDMEVFLAAFKFVRSLPGLSSSWKGGVGEEVSPGPGLDDTELKDYVKKNLGVVFHPVGTAAMVPKELGGVVDNELRVYGVERLRVVDASIFPIEFSLHPLATIYAMAEKASDLIGGST